MQISITSFLETGSLLGLSCGCSMADIVGACGAPEWDELKEDETRVLAYGPMQWWLEAGELVLYGVYPLIAETLPKPLEWADFVPTASTTLDEFLTAMEARGIEHRMSEHGGAIALITPAGVYTLFGRRRLMGSMVRPCPGSRSMGNLSSFLE